MNDQLIADEGIDVHHVQMEWVRSSRPRGQHRRPQPPLAERVAYRAAWIVGVPIKRWGRTRVGAVVGAAIASGLITGAFSVIVRR